MFLGFLPSEGKAEDCRQLAEAISKERTLLTRKGMIEDAMKVCPGDAEIVYQHGYTLERLRKYEDALASYKRAIAIAPDYAKAHSSIGDIQMILKNYQEAAEAYEAGLRYEPGDERSHASLKEARERYRELTGKALPAAAIAPPVVAKAVPEKAIEPKHETRAVEAKAEVREEADPAPAYLVAPIERLQIQFSDSTTELSQEAKDVLGVVVGQAMQRKEMSATRFEVGGHTANTGDPARNMEISRQRAEAVQKYLVVNNGIGAERLKVVAYGQNRPAAPNTSQANQEINRRVDFNRFR